MSLFNILIAEIKFDPKPNISREAKRNLCSTVSKALQKSPEIG